MHIFFSLVFTFLVSYIFYIFAVSSLGKYFIRNGNPNYVYNQHLSISISVFVLGCLFSAWSYGDYGSVIATIFASIGILISISDVNIYKIPNYLLVWAFILLICCVVLFSIAYGNVIFIINSMIVFLVTIFLSVIAFWIKIPIGIGDLKLYTIFLSWLGSFNVEFALYAYILSTVILLLCFCVSRISGIMKQKLAFAPCICVSSLLVWLIFISNTFTLTNIVLQ